MLFVPVWNGDKVSHLSVPLGYRMWQKKESKLELAASMIRQVMPEFHSKVRFSATGKRRLRNILRNYIKNINTNRTEIKKVDISLAIKEATEKILL